MRPRGLVQSLTLLAAVSVGTACAPPDSPESSEPLREQRGDTTVVRSQGAGLWGDTARLVRTAGIGAASGSDTVTLGDITAIAMGPDGRIYATDGQRLALRVFDAELQPLAIWGRGGSGPGELLNPDGGLAVLTNGRVAVRDPGNARLQLFDGEGRPAGELLVIPGGLRTRDNVGRQADTLLSRVVVDASGPIDSWSYGLARISPDGTVLDTLQLPTPALPPQRLVARGGNNTAELPLPFAATSLWAWHPNGGFATARGDRYAITWPGEGGYVRAEREVNAAPVTGAEAAQERAYVSQGLRWLDPSWTWEGPDIPGSKPHITRLFTGEDGSVWVLREGEAQERDDPDYDPEDPASVDRRLRSRLTFDVFDATGGFLGSLDVPDGLQLQPQPVFDASGLIGLELDDSGVPRLVRYRRGGGG
jgi:hypothetical protein